MKTEIILSNTRGFCAGVTRAIDIVEKAIVIHSKPVYVLHEIIHNQNVVNGLKEKGAVFVESISDIPDGEVLIFSAHGVSDKIKSQASYKRLKVIDATCPLVERVHNQAKKLSRKGYIIIIIGDRNHKEVEGTIGCIEGPYFIISSVGDINKIKINNKENRLAYVTQTTLSVDDTNEIVRELIIKYPEIEGPGTDNICYATQNRQNAVKEMIDLIDILIVVGATNSSNSNRLKEVGENLGKSSYLINDATEIKQSWINNGARIGLTAGASAPEYLVQEALNKLNTFGEITVINFGQTEGNMYFNTPSITKCIG